MCGSPRMEFHGASSKLLPRLSESLLVGSGWLSGDTTSNAAEKPFLSFSFWVSSSCLYNWIGALFKLDCITMSQKTVLPAGRAGGTL